MKLTAETIMKTARALDRVKSIDDDIEALGRGAENKVADLGRAARAALGRTVTGHLSNDRLGEILLCGAINALLDIRADRVAEHGDTVDFPPAPCPRQIVQAQE